jgi:hypothetical protein
MRRRTETAGAALCLVLLAAAAPGAGQMALGDPRVEAAIEKYKQALLACQVDGHWPAFDGAFGTGERTERTAATGLAVTALLEAGVRPQDPGILAALKWLTEQKEGMTVSLACRMMACAATNQPSTTRGTTSEKTAPAK